MTLMKTRLWWVMLAVIAFDFAITLLGQPSSYWSDPHTAREANHLFAWFMTRGIFCYLAFVLTYVGLVGILVRSLPGQSGLITGFVFLLSHYFAGCTWLTLRFGLGMFGPALYALLLSIAIISITTPGNKRACLRNDA